ncbi:MAG: lytic transglycosylase domain-containing protein [Desulfobacterales bacterium]
MKYPLNVNRCIKPGNSARVRNFQGLSPKGLKMARTSETFISLLADRIDKSEKDDGLHNALSLGRDHLRRLIEAVEIQMNDYLLSELGDFDECSQDATVSMPQRIWTNYYGRGNNAAPTGSKIKPEPQRIKGIISPYEINEIIEKASNIYGVDPELLTAVIKTESNFDAGATSSKGAMGLMQLMPETAKELGVKNCYDPVENIMAGTRYLKSLLNRYDDNVDLTLAAYNWGMGNVERQPDRLPKETRSYIARINGFLQKETS